MALITEAQSGPNGPLFLDLIAFSEGTSTDPLTKNDGYDVMVTGIEGPEIFTSYLGHPFANRPGTIVNVKTGLVSTAAGRYQLLYRYWLSYRHSLGLPDFSPLSQDKIAIQQIREQKALEPLAAGDIERAIALCSNIWASFPGNTYGQGGRSMTKLTAKWAELKKGTDTNAGV